MKSLTYATVTTLASCRNPVTERRKKKELLLPYLVDPKIHGPMDAIAMAIHVGGMKKFLLKPKSIDF